MTARTGIALVVVLVLAVILWVAFRSGDATLPSIATTPSTLPGATSREPSDASGDALQGDPKEEVHAIPSGAVEQADDRVPVQEAAGLLTITGRVVDLEGAPVDAASVVVRRNGEGKGPLNRWAETDAEGRFRFSSLHEGEYRVAALKKAVGFGCERGVAAGSADLRVVLGGLGTVMGRVYDRDTEEGIGGIAIRAWHTSDTEALHRLPLLYDLLDTPRTNRDGRYEIPLPAPGEYLIQLASGTGDSIAPELGDGPRVTVGEGERVDGIDFALELGGSISGFVIDADGVPVAEARVQLIDKLNDQGGARATTRSEADGSYAFRGRKPGGTYVVLASHADHGAAESEVVTIRKVEHIEAVDVQFLAAHALRGRVVTSSGEGAGGLTVDLIRSGGHRWRAIELMRATTEDDGRFEIVNVAQGAYQPTVTTSPMTKVVGASFTMPADRDLEDVVIDIGKAVAGAISGVIRNEEGEPVGRVEVVAYAEPVVGVANSAEDGSYRIDGLGSVESVSVEAKGFRTGHSRATRHGVVVGSEEVDFVLARDGKAAGIVVDARTGLPITEFEAQWGSWGWKAFSSEEGRFTFDKIKRKRVRFQARARGYVKATTGMIEIESAASQDAIVIELEPGLALRGRVLDDATGVPLGDVRIKTFDTHLASEELTREFYWGDLDPITGDDGLFEITGLPAGEPVDLVAWREDYAPSMKVRVRAAAGGELLFRLRRGGGIAGQVTFVETPVVPAVLIAVLRRGQREAKTLSTYKTVGQVDSSGAFRLKSLPEGSYDLICYDTRLREKIWEGRCTVAADEVKTVEIRITP